MIVKNQLSQREAQYLFEYRDGNLYWKHAASGRRRDLLASTMDRSSGRARKMVRIGSARFHAQYLVWNWHHGKTKSLLTFRDGDKCNISVGNLTELPAPEHVVSNNNFIATRSAPQGTSNLAGGGVFIGTTFTSPMFGVPCPCCRQPVDVPTLDVVVLHYGLTDFETRILRTVWRGGGHPVMANTIFDEMYADDEDGGPDPATMSSTLKVCLNHMREKLKGSGISIETIGYRRGYRLLMKEQEDGNVV